MPYFLVSYINMANVKPVNVSLTGYFKLSETQTLMIEDEKALMSEVSYASVMGSLMYVMVYTRSNIIKQ